MEEEKDQLKIVSTSKDKVVLYDLFSNPVKDLFIIIVLFLLGYYVLNIFTIEVNIVEPQYVIDAQNNSVKPFKVDLSILEKLRFIEVNWHGLPVGIYKRTKIDFENLSKRHLKQVNPADNSKVRKTLKKYLMDNNNNQIDDKLRSIRDEYFVFIMLSPVNSCKLTVPFIHDGRDKNKGKFSKIISACTLQTYLMNGKLSIESYYNNQFIDKVYTNFLLIPNHRFIDDNTIELIPNE